MDQINQLDQMIDTKCAELTIKLDEIAKMIDSDFQERITPDPDLKIIETQLMVDLMPTSHADDELHKLLTTRNATRIMILDALFDKTLWNDTEYCETIKVSYREFTKGSEYLSKMLAQRQIKDSVELLTRTLL